MMIRSVIAVCVAGVAIASVLWPDEFLWVPSVPEPVSLLVWGLLLISLASGMRRTRPIGAGAVAASKEVPASVRVPQPSRSRTVPAFVSPTIQVDASAVAD
jgi:hypothetical protein